MTPKERRRALRWAALLRIEAPDSVTCRIKRGEQTIYVNKTYVLPSSVNYIRFDLTF